MSVLWCLGKKYYEEYSMWHSNTLFKYIFPICEGLEVLHDMAISFEINIFYYMHMSLDYLIWYM